MEQDMTETGYNFCDNAPENFSFCFNKECTTADKCLRALAARDLTPKRRNISIINPLQVNPEGGAACPFFRMAEKQRIAYGFQKAMNQVKHGEIRMVSAHLIGLNNRRTFYYQLSGEKPIYPATQRRIIAILAACGVPQPIEFDRYDYQYVWESYNI